MSFRFRYVWLALLLAAAPARAQDALTVANAQPTGELASLEQAAEIRIRFSEPMVAIGRLPDQVTAPFVAIRPAIAGTYRWAGPTLLVFTPDPKQPLPTATRYDVTVAATATAVSGRTLGAPVHLQLHDADGAAARRQLVPPQRTIRSAGDPRAPLQPGGAPGGRARACDGAGTRRHDWQRPDARRGARARMGADGAARFDAKVAAAAAVAASTAAVPLRLAPDWDKKQFPAARRSRRAADADGAGDRRLGAADRRHPDCRRSAGVRRRTRSSSATVRLDRTFFVDAFRCRSECDADNYNNAVLRARGRGRRAAARRLGARRHRPRARDRGRQGRRAADAARARPSASTGSAWRTWDSSGSRRRARMPSAWPPISRRSMARLSAIRGSTSSRTGTTARSRASATATASGKPAAALCRSSRATSPTCGSGPRRSRPTA